VLVIGSEKEKVLATGPKMTLFVCLVPFLSILYLINQIQSPNIYHVVSLIRSYLALARISFNIFFSFSDINMIFVSDIYLFNLRKV
jgi:hypothetical protein